MLRLWFCHFEESESSFFYRAGSPLSRLSLQKKVDSRHVDIKNGTDWRRLIGPDIWFLGNPTSLEHLKICKRIKDLGIKLWVDYDHLFFMDENLSMYEKRNMGTIIAMADAVSVPTESFKTEINSLNKNIHVVQSAIDDIVFKVRSPRPRENRIMANITKGSDADFFHFSSSINFCHDQKDSEFIYFGKKHHFLYGNERTIFCERLPLFDYWATLQIMAPALVHIPLAQNRVNEARSGIQAAEAAFFGAIPLVPEIRDFMGPFSLHYKNEHDYMNQIMSLDFSQKRQDPWECYSDKFTLRNANPLRVRIIEELGDL